MALASPSVGDRLSAALISCDPSPITAIYDPVTCESLYLPPVTLSPMIIPSLFLLVTLLAITKYVRASN